jgi:acyl-homoserine lactone acylase PvdQ
MRPTGLANWRRGDVHRLQLNHPLGSVKILQRLFHLNRKPYPLPGSLHTIRASIYDLNRPFTSSISVSRRHIFSAAVWDSSPSIIPTGISGIPGSHHHCDQTDWQVQGRYRQDIVNLITLQRSARYTTIFLPEAGNE